MGRLRGRGAVVAVVAAVGVAWLAPAAGAGKVRTHRRSFFSEPYRIDQIYRSMKGPSGIEMIRLLKVPKPELLWITGYHARIVDPVSGKPRSAEFMCHSNLNYLYHARAKNRVLEIGLEHVDHFSSEKGIPVYKDHEYELVTVYDNTSGQPQDSMAVMFLYMLDRDFRKPVLN